MEAILKTAKQDPLIRLGGSPPGERVRQWGLLILSFGAILFFIFVVAPLGQKIPSIGTLAAFIEDRDINASALYYTEVEEAAEAELILRHTLDYGNFE